MVKKKAAESRKVDEKERLLEALPALERQLHRDMRPGTEKTSDAQFRIRRTLIESDKSDPMGMERIIGASDLVSINYLLRGMRASQSVCKLRVPMPRGEWCGTGFLVGPRLLMTNNHVLSSPEDAAQCEAEFGYEHDADGVLQPPNGFNLAPHEIFFTDVELDVTLVSVAPLSNGGVPLDRYGMLPLIPLSGKGLHGEWVSIIQHPMGMPKQIATRDSQILELSKKEFPYIRARFIHYTTDTDPGSSGAPVLNDQWQVVAIHHRGIRNPKFKPRGDANPLDPSSGPNSPLNVEPGSSTPGEWIANEGVRISAISRLLEEKRFSNRNASAALERIAQGMGLPALPAAETVEARAIPDQEASAPKPVSYWNKVSADAKLGYDPEFLPVPLDFEAMLAPVKAKLAKTHSGGNLLDYLHFSVAIHAERKFAMATAVNIHGQCLTHPGGRSDNWRLDLRMDEEYQPADNFYNKNRGEDPVSFSRGHLVRRFDPCWSTKSTKPQREAEARIAEEHTFHFSNAAPQVQRYNNVEWGDLEDYVLDRTQTKEKRVSVFSGPIFRRDDPEYGRTREGGPWQIPVSFWKIAVIERPGDTIACAAFIVGQVEYVQALYESKVFSSLSPYTVNEIQTRQLQVTIGTIEEVTRFDPEGENSGLDLSALRPYDAQGALEATRHTRFIRQLGEIVI